MGSTHQGLHSNRRVDHVIARTLFLRNFSSKEIGADSCVMRMSRAFRSIASLLMLCAFQVQAGQDGNLHTIERTYITEARNAAAGFAVTSWMVQVDSLGTHCAKLEGQPGKDALHALASWQARNMPYVDAALTYIVRIEELLRTSQGEAARKKFRDDRAGEFVTSTRRAQVEWLPEGKATERDCLGLAMHAARGDLDLDKHAEHFAILRTIKVDMDGMAGP
jgi:hypothetical protein